MKRIRVSFCAVLLCVCGPALAVEQTVKNDSITNSSNATAVYGFNAGEAVASWLTSPCNGTIVAVQVLWRSPAANQPVSIQDAVEVWRAGTFPNPGALQASIVGPVLTDGVFNEWRFLDENNTVPLSVSVTQNEKFVVSLTMLEPPTVGGASVVRDNDGNQSGRNALLADLGGGTFVWFNSSTLGVAGDWAIRAVVDCPAAPVNADVAATIQADRTAYIAGQPLGYTITVTNNGPAASPATSIVDIFPSGYTATAWSCVAAGGASCASTGSGNITASVNLPVGGSVAYVVQGTVTAGTTGTLTNAVATVVGSPAVDPEATNNTASIALERDNDLIFRDTFDP